MSSETKYGEPWMTSEFGRYVGGAKWSLCGQAEPYQFRIVATSEHEAITRRIALCVNFCRNLTD